jgi:hypothetical protein
MLLVVAGMTGVPYVFSVKMESRKVFAQAGLELQSS